MKHFQLMILVFLAGSLAINAQAPAMQWHQGHGTDLGEHVHEGMQTGDGGYIGIGQTDEAREKGFDLLVVKTDAEGNLEWQRIIGSPGKSEVGICVEEVEDGFLIGGGLWSDGSQKRYLSKLDRKGETLWEHYYEGPGHDAIRGMDINEDGSIITTGYKGASRGGFIFISEGTEGFIMKTDGEGNPIWDKKISPPQGTKVRIDHDGKGYVIVSTIRFDGARDEEVLLLRCDEHGNEFWSDHYGGEDGEHCYDFDLTMDGGYICGGHSRSYGVNWDFYLLKIDSEGKEQWFRTFGQPRGYDPEWIHDEAYGVRQTPDGGYVIVGGTGDEFPYSEKGHPRGPSDIWQVYLVKTDGDGNKLWEGVYGSPDAHDAGEYMGLTSDGGFIIFVDADSAGDMEPNNFGFMKIGGDGIPGE
jgi:hypothetical protein